MAPLPYRDTGAAIAFYFVFGTFALLEWRVRLRSWLSHEGSGSDRGSRRVLYAVIVAGMTAGFSLAALHGTAIRFARWPIFVIGVLLMAGGIAIRQWAVAVLGQFFTTDVRLHSGQEVIDDGPYRWVRHPSYSGLLMTIYGVGLALGNWASLAAIVVLPTIAIVYRIRVEETALLEGLGEPYRRFAADRSRLVPHLW